MTATQALNAIIGVLVPLTVPVGFFCLILLPLVHWSRKWYADKPAGSHPMLEMFIGPPPKPKVPTEGAPLLKRDGESAGESPSLLREALDLLLCTAGVLVSHLVYGYYQEQLMTSTWSSTTDTLIAQPVSTQSVHSGPWNQMAAVHASGGHLFGAGADTALLSEQVVAQDDGEVHAAGEETFLHASFTTLLNRVCSLVLALVVMGVARLANGGPLDTTAAPLWEYSIAALANNISSVAQYASIHFISFPTLVLSKACKMPPVMFVNVLVFGRGYRAYEYTGAMLVLMGASLWLLYDEGGSSHHDERFRNTDSIGGFFLVGIYIASDAYASTWQGHVFSRGTSIYPMFLWSNVWACVASGLSSFVTTEFSEALDFLNRHPAAWSTLAILSIASAFGNLFLLYTIQRFGPLGFASIATVRQLLSSLISIAAFHHAVQLLQITGLLIVFLALGMLTSIKLHERRLNEKKRLLAARAAIGYKTEKELVMTEEELMEEETWSKAGRWLSMTCELKCLRPQLRALLVMGIVVFVAVVKSYFARTAILSTQQVSSDGGQTEIQTTGVAFSALSCANTVMYASIIFIIEPASLATPSWDLVPALAVISVLSGVDIAFTCSAIARLPALQQQVIAASHPIITIIFESIFACQLKHPGMYLIVATIAIGAGMITMGSDETLLDASVRESPFASTRLSGSLMMLTAVVAAALKYVVVKYAVRAKKEIGTISFVFWVDMVAFLSISSVAILNNEFATLVTTLTSSSDSMGLSVHFFIACSLGGARFFTEVFALRFVTAVDVSAAKTVANVIYICLALMAPRFINANAPQYHDLHHVNNALTNGGLLFSGLVLLVGSLVAYWWLQRRLGTSGLVVSTCLPTCCVSFGVLSGHGCDDLESDLSRRADEEDEPCSTCCGGRSEDKLPPDFRAQ